MPKKLVDARASSPASKEPEQEIGNFKLHEFVVPDLRLKVRIASPENFPIGERVTQLVKDAFPARVEGEAAAEYPGPIRTLTFIVGPLSHPGLEDTVHNQQQNLGIHPGSGIYFVPPYYGLEEGATAHHDEPRLLMRIAVSLQRDGLDGALVVDPSPEREGNATYPVTALSPHILFEEPLKQLLVASGKSLTEDAVIVPLDDRETNQAFMRAEALQKKFGMKQPVLQISGMSAIIRREALIAAVHKIDISVTDVPVIIPIKTLREEYTGQIEALVELMKAKGAASITIVITHPRSKSALLQLAGIEGINILVSNSILSSTKGIPRNVSIIDEAPLLAQSIIKICKGDPLNPLEMWTEPEATQPDLESDDL